MTEPCIHLVGMSYGWSHPALRYAALTLDLRAVRQMLRDTQQAANLRIFQATCRAVPAYHASWLPLTLRGEADFVRYAALANSVADHVWTRMPDGYDPGPSTRSAHIVTATITVTGVLFTAILVPEIGVRNECEPSLLPELPVAMLRSLEQELYLASCMPIAPAPVQRRRFIT